jgi:hypothetical protein
VSEHKRDILRQVRDGHISPEQARELLRRMPRTGTASTPNTPVTPAVPDAGPAADAIAVVGASAR